MTEQDRAAFSEAMRTLAAVYGGDTTTAALEKYWEVLSRYPGDKVLTAIDDVYTSRKFRGMPTPAEILDLVKPEWKEPPKFEDKSIDDVLMGTVKGRFNRYISLTRKWDEVCDRNVRGELVQNDEKWKIAFSAWEAADQPMPTKGAPILKRMI